MKLSVHSVSLTHWRSLDLLVSLVLPTMKDASRLLLLLSKVSNVNVHERHGEENPPRYQSKHDHLYSRLAEQWIYINYGDWKEKQKAEVSQQAAGPWTRRSRQGSKWFGCSQQCRQEIGAGGIRQSDVGSKMVRKRRRLRWLEQVGVHWAPWRHVSRPVYSLWCMSNIQRWIRQVQL